MARPKGDGDLTKRDRSVVVLQAHFPNISDSNASLLAKYLLETSKTGAELHHSGKADRDAVIQIEKNVSRAKLEVEQMSLWMQKTYDIALHRGFMANSPKIVDGEPVRIPGRLAEVLASFEAMISASHQAENSWKNGRASHGKNWKAVVVVDEARRIWKSQTGKSPPDRHLNEDTKFAGFLNDIFNAIGVGAKPSSAYDAWWDISSDPDSLLSLPD